MDQELETGNDPEEILLFAASVDDGEETEDFNTWVLTRNSVLSPDDYDEERDYR